MAALVCCAAATAYWWPALADPAATGFGDWQSVHHNWEAAYHAVVRHREWPLFDPFHCGGITLVGNPEAQHFSPLFLLSFATGTTLATKVFVILHAAAGLLGAYLHARRAVRLSRPAATAAATVFAGSGFFAWQLAGGHATFAPFWFFPWLLLGWRLSLRDVRGSVGVAAVLALAAAEGGTYPVPYMLVGLAIEALRVPLGARGDQARMAWRATVRAATVGGVLTVLLAAPRALPVGATLRRIPRAMPSVDGLSPADLVTTLVARNHDWRWPGHEFVWAEYGAFIGWGALALAAAGAVASARRPRRTADATGLTAPPRIALLVGAALAAALMLGNWPGPGAPWRLLHALPVFDALRVPSRFAFLLVFHLSLLAGRGIDASIAPARPTLGPLRGARRVRAALAWLLAFGVATDIVAATRAVVDRWDGAPLEAPTPAERLHLVPTPDYYRVFARLPERNLGTESCYEGAMPWPVSPRLWTGDVPQARFEDGSGGASARASVRAASRTTTRMVADVDVPDHGSTANARLVWNVNYDPGWKSDVGVVVEDAGRVAVDLPPGTTRVVLVFVPEGFGAGVLLGAVGLVLSAGLLVSGAGRGRVGGRAREGPRGRPH
jgi:hypothetical protein